MALSAPGIRPTTRGHLSRRLLALGLAAAVVLGGTYTAFTLGGRAQQPPVYQTAPVTRVTLQTTVSATGPVTSPQSVPLLFKSAGKLAQRWATRYV
jgi:multidrug efflux pump subunit AcrA (membrane-fusion protein)